MRTFTIRQHPAMRAMAWSLGGAHGHVDVDDTAVRVRHGVMFRTTIPRSIIGPPQRYEGKVYSWGVHGWRGRWLVNGSSHGIVVLPIEPRRRAHVLGWPIRLRELAVSLDDPDGFLAALDPSNSRQWRAHDARHRLENDQAGGTENIELPGTGSP